ncbi:MAG: hypothetical protein US86_C0003G0033 [Candidatus Daviesbacteria bacterium GW2011_GWA2_38_24]|uniref:Uncharacterized protein n=1 Tax=Candidatus Daviesbacteria bacterium GW2011_GWA2_38_24 TaxID=1618422 RepID=A0A0G0JUS3_9BACT|nr:MAG: hypothetical protein US86_C0003G0033 [Candidatus Daviesbacteria bacterium GW2011_GWA2_38_24]KKQ80360.1 MAG: hypothetical protein UT01_C0014G0019 [Candidatus Daviesbacteria bacterium GW2011_GWA1_38_7]OGE24666.1 MAG: hypothetical protein A2688_01220 [Candidatus Daviesbacteria bacterium RIFCSPHIGHO2_01_FULL_38_8]
MVIKNLTNKNILSIDAKICSSIFDKLLGMLNKNNPRTLIFYTRFGVHTFGLIKPIDVLVLDKQDRVVKLKKSLKPNSLFFWNPKYSLVIEVPEKTIEKTKTYIGDKMIIESS